MADGFTAFLQLIAGQAQAAGVFGAIGVANGVLSCAAKDAAEPAEYRIFTDAGKVWVAFVTANRWLSESVESDLEHTGDEIEELVAEELDELNYTGDPLGACQHFRDDHKLFTFRSALPIAATDSSAGAAKTALTCLLGYEACFRRLGDVGGARES